MLDALWVLVCSKQRSHQASSPWQWDRWWSDLLHSPPSHTWTPHCMEWDWGAAFHVLSRIVPGGLQRRDLFSLCAARCIQAVISSSVELTQGTQEQCSGPSFCPFKLNHFLGIVTDLSLPLFCFIPSTPTQIFLECVLVKAANKNVFFWCRHNWLWIYNDT